MGVDLLLGLQWGDEGKGKIVDVLTSNYDIIARFQGGPNAGHTLVFNDKKYVLHTIPSGIFHDNKINLIGNGVVIDPVILNKEIENIKAENVDISKTLFISRKAHLILPTHRLIDAASEKAKGKNKIGSTLKGIGPTYMDKTGRNGFRIGDLENEDWKTKYFELSKKHQRLIKFYDVEIDFSLEDLEIDFFDAIEKLRKITFVDSENLLFNSQDENKSILAEGAQGSLLDIDFGTYPYVTSSNTTAAGACTGLGISPNSINDVFGIFKAYTTRVGSGPFPTELFDEYGKRMSKVGNEFGATTGRPRRCGWLDGFLLSNMVKVSGVDGLCLTKIDVLDGLEKVKISTDYISQQSSATLMETMDIEGVEPVYLELEGWTEPTSGKTKYDELNDNAKLFIEKIEEIAGVPVIMISTGPKREDTIIREKI